ncbi:MAG: FAD-dependent oxidoreductase [Ignavibacteria bacterium]|nr:FAD-dependent oxidoreductase [Ignavibacteria bacterium]
MKRSVKILVVGGSAAGPAAAAKAKRYNPSANLILFEAGNFISTGTCEIPYVLSGDISNYDDIVYYSAGSFLNKKGVRVFVNHFVEQIDRKLKTITVCDLKSDTISEFQYDSLILTTGSQSKTLTGFSKELKNVFHLKNIDDLIKVESYLKNNSVQTAIVIGSGYIGLEATEALYKNKVEVTLIEKESLPLPFVEYEISNRILADLENYSIRFMGKSKNVEPFIGDDKVVSIKCDDDMLQADLVLSTVGITPNNILAKKAKLEIGKFGGIKVDKKLKTSDRNIFAAGDNMEFTNVVTGKPDYFPFATYAHSFGHIAGENAAGGNVNAEPIVKNVSVKIFDNYFAAVGVNSIEAGKSRFNTVYVDAEVPNLIKVMPESKPVYGKLIFDIDNKKILGASFYGGKEVSGYADLISSAIYSGQQIDFLTKVSYNYTPPLSPFVNLLSVLGRKAIVKLKK